MNNRLGEIKMMNCGMKAKIIEYLNCNNITVEFEDGYITKNKRYRNFNLGSISNPNVKVKSLFIKEDRTNECGVNNQGLNMKILHYNNANDIDIIFENDNTVIKNKSYKSFKKGEIINPNFYKNIRIGETNYNNQGCLMKIIDYETNKNIIVEFQDKYKYTIQTQYEAFKLGNLKNPYFKHYFNECYIGEDYGNINKKNYTKWINMIKRCYDQDFKRKHPTYKDCFVCEEWKCYSNFNKWCNENYYEIGNEIMDLDKDILVKGNKMYSPETCVFVPQKINKLFIKSNKVRGKYPIGVCKIKNKFSSDCNKNGEHIHLGYFNTIEDAFITYKNEKEKYIKQVADEYRLKIPKKLYDAMYKWEVEITD